MIVNLFSVRLFGSRWIILQVWYSYKNRDHLKLFTPINHPDSPKLYFKVQNKTISGELIDKCMRSDDTHDCFPQISGLLFIAHRKNENHFQCFTHGRNIPNFSLICPLTENWGRCNYCCAIKSHVSNKKKQ